MRSIPRTRTAHCTTPRAAAVAALLLAATAAAASPASAAGSTGTAFEVKDLTAVLSLDAALDDATALTTVDYDGGKPVVTAQLGTVTVSDKRMLGLTLPWSYTASVPGDVEPVKSKGERVARSGPKPSKSGATFRVLDEPVGNGSATFTHKDQWTTVNSSGAVPKLVERSVLGTSTVTTFKPEMRLVLPEDTAAGAYEVVVTHSVS